MVAPPRTRSVRSIIACAALAVALIGGGGDALGQAPQPAAPRDPSIPGHNADTLAWDALASFDAVYFTGACARSLVFARAARALVVTARRAHVVAEAGVVPDVLVGSASDPRENAPFSAYVRPPRALVLTQGPGPIRVEAASGLVLADAPPPVADAAVRGDYGAGDSFAAALTYFVAAGHPVAAAARLAGPFGAAVLSHESPLESPASLG